MDFERAFLLLRIPYGVGIDKIKEAYRKASGMFHPDVNKHKAAEEAFKECLSAYDFLMENVKVPTRGKKRPLGEYEYHQAAETPTVRTVKIPLDLYYEGGSYVVKYEVNLADNAKEMRSSTISVEAGDAIKEFKFSNGGDVGKPRLTLIPQLQPTRAWVHRDGVFVIDVRVKASEYNRNTFNVMMPNGDTKSYPLPNESGIVELVRIRNASFCANIIIIMDIIQTVDDID
jgi:hypothetical protein